MSAARELSPRERCAKHGPAAVRMFDQLTVARGFSEKEASALVGWAVFSAPLGALPDFDADRALASLKTRKVRR